MTDKRLVLIVACVGAAVLVTVFLLSLLLVRTPAVRADQVAAGDTQLLIQPAHRARPKTTAIAQPSAPPSRLNEPLPPVIDEVTVEKEEVCEGEENLITVKAHAQDDSAPLLHVVIGSQKGNSVPVRTWLDPNTGAPMGNRISVFGRASALTSIDVPPYRVKRCRPERVVTVGVRALANRVDDFELTATFVDNAPKRPFRPVRYLWDFGDGDGATTETPRTTHRYHRPIQNTLYSSYLIQVEVLGESGESVLGRTSFDRYNLGYEHLIKFGLVALFAEGHPRFPVLSEDGVVRQKFEIWHTYEQSVEIQKISLVLHDSEGRRTETSDQMDITFLDETEIQPGKSIDGEFKFEPAKYPGVLALVFRLEGTSADGKKAIGEFSIMKPPPKPTRENSRPVTDPRVVAKIQKAIQILGQETVTEEDIWRLERQGKLQ